MNIFNLQLVWIDLADTGGGGGNFTHLKNKPTDIESRNISARVPYINIKQHTSVL